MRNRHRVPGPWVKWIRPGEGKFKGHDVRGKGKRGTNINADLSNGVRTKATGQSRLAASHFSNGQRLECRGDVFSQPPFSQGRTSGEQQMKLTSADKAYVPNADTIVLICWGGFPRDFEFLNHQV